MSLTLSPHTSEQEHLQGEALRRLTRELPMNEYGLPLGVYRVDLLPFHDYQSQAAEEEVLALTEGAVEGFQPFSKPEEHNDSLVMLTGDGKSPFDDIDDLQEDEEPEAEWEVGEPEEGLTDRDVYNADKELHLPSIERRAGFPRHALQRAFIPLSYSEGFPTFPDGCKFWDQMDCESQEAYTVFCGYLQMDRIEGVRSIANLPAALSGSGLIQGDASEYVNKLQLYSHIYYWHLRAKAFDLFKAAAFRRQMDLRAIQTMDDHYLMSRKLLRKVFEWMGEDDNFIDGLTPKVAIDAVKTLSAMERLSAGIPAAAPASEKGENASSFEMILRQIAQKGNTETVKTEDGHELILQKAMDDPETLATFQELIVRTTKGGK